MKNKTQLIIAALTVSGVVAIAQNDKRRSCRINTASWPQEPEGEE